MCVAAITTSRADYSHLYWPLREISERPGLRLELLVSGAHLSPRYGHTIDDIRSDGFPIAGTIECLLSSDSDVGMAKTIGVATLGFADALERIRPNILLLIADRYEMLAPASVATAMRIPIAHIEGGELSAGAFDDAIRHALTKLSHIHFTPTSAARRRVLALGEEPWRVFRTGAPSLDHLRRTPPRDRQSLWQELGLADSRPLVVVAVHPVTLLDDTTAEIDAVFAALEQLSATVAFCFPNADAGNRKIIARAQTYCANGTDRHLFVNLSAHTYLSLLSTADLMVGNSSSGIMETPAFELPTVNVGRRQEGRERAANIIDVPAHREAIVDAIHQGLSREFRGALSGMTNPYGDGQAAHRIADVLEDLPDRDRLLFKRHSDV